MAVVLLCRGWSAHGVHAGRASVCGRLEGRGLVDFRVLESHLSPFVLSQSQAVFFHCASRREFRRLGCHFLVSSVEL